MGEPFGKIEARCPRCRQWAVPGIQYGKLFCPFCWSDLSGLTLRFRDKPARDRESRPKGQT